MTVSPSTNLEKENLEAHVDLCALRYEQLDKRLTALEEKMSEMHTQMIIENRNLKKVIITSTATIIASVIGLVTTIIIS
jgi:hypothetical protein